MNFDRDLACSRGRFQNLLVVVGSIAFSLAFAECGLRLYHHGNLAGLSGEHSLRIPHPVRGWTLDAGGAAFQRTKDYGVHVRINSKGLRDREHAYEPAPGVFRIVVLGDSFMEAYQVPLEDSLPYLLQERLAERKVELLSAGLDEVPAVYKDIEAVMRAQSDLVRPLASFQPRMVRMAKAGERPED